MSNYLQIPKDEIFIMNPRSPPFKIDLYVEYLNDFKKTRIKEYIRTKRKEIVNIKESILLEGCKLSPEIFDPKYDMRPQDWPKKPSQRANIKYYPPYNYTGFGLKVLGTYDNGDNTWIGMCNKDGEFAVAYHGIRSNIEAVKNILNSYLKSGKIKLMKMMKMKYVLENLVEEVFMSLLEQILLKNILNHFMLENQIKILELSFNVE